jgi:hypothetical protein
MGRKSRQQGGHSDSTDWEAERTMADAEEDAAVEATGTGTDTSCPCGSHEFVLEAFLHVVDGKVRPEPIDVESLTCPQCGREFEAVEGEGGVILRGAFLGHVEVEDD